MSLRRDFIKIPLAAAFGGWTVADKAHFADGGSFDQINTRK